MCVVTFDWSENDAKEKFKNFEKRKSLSWAVIEVTDYCNFNCKWCFANAGQNLSPRHMEKENLKTLITALANSGLKQITLSGGEPTLYPHLKEIIEWAHSYGLVVHMNTNGYLLSKDLAIELKSAGLSQVQINIDSLDPRKHDYVRGKKGSFHRAIKALKNAREAGLTCVSQTVLTKENENEIIDIFKFARSMGIQRCRVWDMTPSKGYAKENMDLMPTDYITTLQKLSDFAYETGAQSVETGEPLFPLNFKTDLNVIGGYCVAVAGLYCTISNKGDVYFCATLREPLYNIFEEMGKGRDIRNIHQYKINEYLGSVKEVEKCKMCKFLQSCKGGCSTRREYKKGIDYWCPVGTELISDVVAPMGSIIQN